MGWINRLFGKEHPQEGTVEYLIAKIKDKGEAAYVRRQAAEELGNRKDRRAVRPLISALKDEDGFVRMAAADSLGCLEDRRAVRPLIAAMKRDLEDPSFHNIAKLALARISGVPIGRQS